MFFVDMFLVFTTENYSYDVVVIFEPVTKLISQIILSMSKINSMFDIYIVKRLLAS